MAENLTRDQAEEQVEQHLQDAAGALPEELELGRVGEVTSPPCGEDDNVVNVSKTYWLDNLTDNEQTTETLLTHWENNHKWRDVELLLEHWQENGYRVVRDSHPERVSLYVGHETDHFRPSVRAHDEGLLLGACSPCVWPEGSRNG